MDQPSTKLIMTGTDGSEGAERAVVVAADLARANDGRLLIVNVDEDGLSHAEQADLGRLRVTEGDALEEISRRILATATALARAHGPLPVETLGAGGDPPADTLIGLANEKHPYAVVIGRRGRGRLEGLLLGSVSQKLAALARCIVVIVP